MGGGWAVWARSDLGRVIRSGACPDYCTDSNDAELAAIYAGLYLVTRNWPQVTAVLVRSDSQVALAYLEMSKPPRNAGARRLWRRIKDLLAQHPLRLRTRWVKGHADPNAGTMAYLNNQCDKLAKQARVGNARASSS